MQQLLGNTKKGFLYIVSAPAGTGKTTIVQRLVEEFPSVVANVSFTTRTPRPGEVDGKDYHFISEAEFLKKIEAGDFLEYVKLYGFYYGTSSKWVNKFLHEGKHVVLVIDIQGALQLQKKIPTITIFLRPPCLKELKRRLKARGTECESKIEERLAIAEQELEAANRYDYEVVNDNLETAYQVIKSIFIAEEHRVRQKYIQI